MSFRVRTIALTLISSLVLVACGGGGGGGGTTAAVPQAVAITESSAKPIAANALDTTQSTAAGELPIGVEVQATAPRAPHYLLAVARASRLASTVGPGATLVTGVTASQQCPLGGSFTTTGDSTSGTLSFSNCKMDEDATLNGTLSMALVSGSTGSIPFHAVISVVATDLSIAADGLVMTLSGDMRLDMTVSSTSEALVVTGSSLSTRVTSGGTTFTNTLKNYSQSVSFNGSVVTGSLSATVESTSTRLGSSGGSYTVSTTTPLVWNESTGTVSSGVIKVVGAGGSQLVMTVNSSTSVTIRIDENGDGTFEKTVSSTQTELRNLL